MSTLFKPGFNSALTSDTDFRAHVTYLHAAILAAGMTQTADTGQVDPTTITRASGGYTVYRFNDAAQATHPVFLRIDWNSGSGQAQARAIASVGYATNGAGTLTGAGWSLSSSFADFPAGNNLLTVAGNGSYLMVIQWSATTGQGTAYGFIMARTCNPATNDPTDDSLFLLARRAGNAGWFHGSMHKGVASVDTALGINGAQYPVSDVNGQYWGEVPEVLRYSPGTMIIGGNRRVLPLVAVRSTMMQWSTLDLPHLADTGTKPYLPLPGLATSAGGYLAVLWE